jgi:hypothetical protein
MSFLPAIPLSAIPSDDGFGGIDVNVDSTLLALVAYYQHCVRIYSLIDQSAAPFIVGTAGTGGSAHGQFYCPISACFVHRHGMDTLLISDLGNHRVVEVSSAGVFLRIIAVKEGSGPFGIKERNGVIAVSLRLSHSVILLQYESGTVIPEVTIGSETWGRGDGQLCHPRGVTFTADGRFILVADWGNNRVSKFSAASGAFVAHVISDGISYPRDVLQCEDGSIAVAQGHNESYSVVCVGEDGKVVQNTILDPSAIEGAFIPHCLAYFPSLSGVVVKTMEGKVFLLRDAWMYSSRCAWLSALAFS